MKTCEREEGLEYFDKFWDEMSQEWFKVELLQDYSGEDAGPSLDAWLAGDRDKSLDLISESLGDMDDWVRTCKEKISKRVRLRRIHVIERPLTPYLEWEIELYKRLHLPIIGEEVSLVEADIVKDLDLPDGDFMIFDLKRATKNTYSPDGKVTHIDVYDEGEDIDYFLSLRDELLKLSHEIT